MTLAILNRDEEERAGGVGEGLQGVRGKYTLKENSGIKS